MENDKHMGEHTTVIKAIRIDGVQLLLYNN